MQGWEHLEVRPGAAKAESSFEFNQFSCDFCKILLGKFFLTSSQNHLCRIRFVRVFEEKVHCVFGFSAALFCGPLSVRRDVAAGNVSQNYPQPPPAPPSIWQFHRPLELQDNLGWDFR